MAAADLAALKHDFVMQTSENALSTAAAVDAAVEKLMRLSLPYLKVVCDCELEADTGEGWPHYIYPFV